MSLNIPDGRLAYPQLLQSGRPADHNYQINWRHPLARGLVHYSLLSKNCRDLVTNCPSVHDGVDDFIVRNERHIKSTTLDDNLSFKTPSRIETVKRNHTIIFSADFDTIESYAGIISIPYRDDGTWTSPFTTFGVTKRDTSTEGRYFYATSSSNTVSADSATDFYRTDGTEYQYGVTRDGATVDFYRDGAFHSTDSLATNADIDHGADKAPLVLLTRSTTTKGDSATGTMSFLAMYNRTLNVDEIKQVHLNHLSMLEVR